MAEKTYSFGQFVENINEAVSPSLVKVAKEAISEIAECLIKGEISITIIDINSRTGSGAFYIDDKSILTMREIPDEFLYILSNSEYEYVHFEKTREFSVKDLIKINDSVSILIQYSTHDRRIFINPLYRGDIKAIEMDQLEMPGLENTHGQIWNGQNLIGVNFDFAEIASEGREYGFYATYSSVNSPDNKSYELTLGFSGSKDDWEFEDIEDLELE